MAIDIKGTTDVSGAASVLAGNSKRVVIIGAKGTGVPTLVPNKPTVISGTKDAATKFGNNQTVVDMVTMLITNDVKSIYGVLVSDVDGTNTIDKAYDSAMHSLMGEPNSKIMIFDTSDVLIIPKIVSNLDLAEQEQIRRYAVLGVPSTADTTEEMATFAKLADHKRIFVAPQLLNTDGTDATDIMAATGLASILATATTDPALPACNVSVIGLGGVKQTFLKSELNALVTAGISPFIMEDGKLITYKVVTSRTTPDDGDFVIWADGTTILIDDYVFENVRARIRANYPRAKNVTRILDAIRGDVIDVLSNAQDLEIIENFNKKLVSVVKDPNDIYGAIMDYTFDVVTPLYTITLTQHMVL